MYIYVGSVDRLKYTGCLHPEGSALIPESHSCLRCHRNFPTALLRKPIYPFWSSYSALFAKPCLQQAMSCKYNFEA